MFSFSSIKDYQSLLLSGRVTCVEAVSFYSQNIKANRHLNAFLEVYEDEALERAALLDAKNNVRRELEDGINETPSQSANNKAQSKATTTTTQP